MQEYTNAYIIIYLLIEYNKKKKMHIITIDTLFMTYLSDTLHLYMINYRIWCMTQQTKYISEHIEFTTLHIYRVTACST